VVEPDEIVRLLRAPEEGDPSAFGQLVPLVYDQLRRLARSQRRQGPQARSLDTTALVQEAYLKLAGSPGLRIRDRGHLMAVTACAMRQVLIGRARARLRHKRGSGADPFPFDEQRLPVYVEAEQLLDLDRAPARCAGTTRGWRRSSSAATSPGWAKRRRPRCSACPCAPSSAAPLRARTWLKAELQGA